MLKSSVAIIAVGLCRPTICQYVGQTSSSTLFFREDTSARSDQPHQLCWIDQELILSKRYSMSNSAHTQYSSKVTSSTSTPTSGFLHGKPASSSTLQKGHLCSQRLLYSCKKRIHQLLALFPLPPPPPPTFTSPPLVKQLLQPLVVLIQVSSLPTLRVMWAEHSLTAN